MSTSILVVYFSFFVLPQLVDKPRELIQMVRLSDYQIFRLGSRNGAVGTSRAHELERVGGRRAANFLPECGPGLESGGNFGGSGRSGSHLISARGGV